MGRDAFLRALFDVIEHITESGLRNTSKSLLMSYLQDAPGHTLAEKARFTVEHYTQEQIPDLETIRHKNKSEEISPLDHLVLKLEYEALHYKDWDK
jgi:hypothetical protein